MSIQVDIKKRFSSFELNAAFDLADDTLGLLGASGCGKSLTMRCVAGVETPDEGKIVVNGKTYFDSSAKINLSPQQRKTALLFQNFQLFPNHTVEQNIAAGIDRSIPKSERNALVAAQIEDFQLHGLEKRYPAFLSGGQQQRVALARMLAARPDILMLDEPFSALDAHLKSQLEQSLLELFDAYEHSILYVSHDIDEALRFCDHIAVLDQGSIVELNEARNVVDHPTTLAGIKLSGCKNISRVVKVDSRKVKALDWDGLELTTQHPVSDEVAYIGFRAFFIKPATDQKVNVVACRVMQTSETRFERTVMVRPVEYPASKDIQWKVDKLSFPADQMPQVGDTISLYLNPANIYPAQR